MMTDFTAPMWMTIHRATHREAPRTLDDVVSVALFVFACLSRSDAQLITVITETFAFKPYF